MKNEVISRDSKPAEKQNTGNYSIWKGKLATFLKSFAKSKDSTPKNYQTKKEDEKRWSRITAKAAIIYTVITAIIMMVGIFQAYISRDSEQRQLRAYVGMSPGDVDNFGQDNQHIRLIRKNSGLTPAYDVGFSSVGFGTVNPGQPITGIPTGCEFHPLNFKLFSMFPNNDISWNINMTTKISEIDIQRVKSGSAYFVYYGNICYNDAFGHSHYTNYCYMYKGDKMSAKDAEACISFNDSD